MTLRPVVLPPDVSGTLWLSSMPGRFGPWHAFDTEARRARLALVVCLTPRHEVAELSPAYHAALDQGTLPFRWQNLPMPNFGLPQDPPAFRRDIAQIAKALRQGDAAACEQLARAHVTDAHARLIPSQQTGDTR